MPSRTQQSLDARLRDLANAVRGEVHTSLHERMLYSTDASIYQAEPTAVVLPDSLEDAARTVAACHELGLPVLPRGGGTSLAGQCVNQAVVIDLSKACTRVTEFDEGSATCTAEAGITIAELNAEIAHSGLFFAPDPSTVRQATLGGCIGNNAAGAHSILYGRTSENVLAIEACLADGNRVWFEPEGFSRDPAVTKLTHTVVDIVQRYRKPIRERFPKTLRRAAGYQLDMILDQCNSPGQGPGRVNLTPLLCGSEGTLAITMQARVKLHPIPRVVGLGVIAFSDLDEAIEAVVPLLTTSPSAIELLDDLILDLARQNPEQRRHIDLLPSLGTAPTRAVLYVEYYAASELELEDRLRTLEQQFPLGSIKTFTDPSQIERAWALRMAGEPLLHGIPGDRTPVGFVEDNAIPPERLAEFVRRFRGIITEEGTTASFYAHASVGVLHVRPLLNLKDSQDRDRMHRIAIQVAALAKSLGGVMSGEHGDGRARGPLLEDFYGPELMRAFAEVKAAFDPENRLNPGNIVSPGPIESVSQSIRVMPQEAPLAITAAETFYEYTDQTDFAHAVERCNGAGVCRKKTGGMMCPSYRATLDERHSTRGRGNALRLALSGQTVLGSDANRWNDADTLETLDLCLSCKACKSECPSNVDLARLKAEYHAQRYAHGARPTLSTRVLSNIATFQSFASRAPGLANWASSNRLTRPLLNLALGIHPKRSLPQFERSLARQWGRKDISDSPARVLLLADTFTTHNEPEIGLATRRVLEAFGYRVDLLLADDLTRAKVSLGRLPQAIRAADTTLARLIPLLTEPSLKAVLVCEPSCLSAITDDWLELKLKTPREDRERLAQLSMLPEQFLESQWGGHPRQPEFLSPADRVMFHAHCHQRALWGPESSSALLKRIFPEAQIETPDTTCCGMAGAFGFDKARYELSMQIGELGVLPMARDAAQNDILLATGTSCRHQIRDGAARIAIHPIQLIDRQIVRLPKATPGN